MIPRTRKRSNFKYSCFFNEYNNSSLQEINKTVKGFQKQIRALQDELESTNKELKDVTIENQKLKQPLSSVMGTAALIAALLFR